MIKFHASLPDIQSAISIGEGARIKIDVPETDLPEVMKLVLMRGKSFTIKVEEESGEIG